jgi:hypothetical protein
MAVSFKPEALTLGLVLVAVGVAWMLSNLGRLDLLDTLRTWWPLSLVVWGGLELVAAVTARNADGRS